MHGKFVAYYRVSTQKQGRSGLGLAAQRAAVAQHLDGGRWELIAAITEVETGQENERPELKRALHLCKVTGAHLIIAKLDRLSRNAAFLLALRDSGTRFVCCDLPQANEFTVGMLAVMAEEERRRISERTKAALAAARARAEDLAVIIADIRSCGIITLAGIAAELDRRGMLTARGGHWHPATVQRILNRLGEGKESRHPGALRSIQEGCNDL